MANPDPERSNLVDLRTRTPQERHDISAKGGLATKGILKPHFWRCKKCRFLKECVAGQAQLKQLREAGERKNPKCIVPEAKRLLLESAMNPERILEASKVLLIDAGIRSSQPSDLCRVSRELRELAAHLSPPVQRILSLNADINTQDGYEIIFEVLNRREAWKKAIPEIEAEFSRRYGGATG